MTRRLLLVLLLVLLAAPRHSQAGEAKAGAELDKMLSKQVRVLLSFARKWQKKDTDTTERALRLVLAIDAENENAQDMLRAIGRAGRLVLLFDGSSLGAWHHADPPQWRVEGREIRGNCKDAAYLMRSIESFEGNYVLRMQARFIRASSTAPTLFSLGGDADDDETRIEMGLLRGLPYFKRKSGDESESLHKGSLDDVKPRLDPNKWNEYELEFTDSQVIARINGQEIARASRGDAKGGYATLVVQECEFAIRRLVARVFE